MEIDWLDMFEAIEAGIDTEYTFVDRAFVRSIRKQLDEGRTITVNQQLAIENIYERGRQDENK